MNVMTLVFSCMTVAGPSFLISLVYGTYFGSRMADYLGALFQRVFPYSSYEVKSLVSYTIGLFFIPLIWGLLIGGLVWCFENSMMEEGGIRLRWWFLVIGAVSSLLPFVYYVVFMTFFMEGS